MQRIVLMLVASCVCCGVVADEVVAENAVIDDRAPGVRFDPDRTLTVTWENDKFGGTDRNYTNGFRIALFDAAPDTGRPSKWLARTFLGADDDTVVRRQFALGHSIFTPEDIDTAEPLPDQHPYAGWLYGEYAVLVQQRDQVERLSIQLGIVGPSAGGEWLQSEIHRAINVDRPRGWDNQIDDEVGVVLYYDRKFRELARTGVGRYAFDLIPSYGISLGNVQTSVRAGFTARFGQDLRNDFGPPRVVPAAAGTGFFTPRDGLSWYMFAGVDARAVAHNIFLEGSLFRDSDPSVTPKTVVYDWQIGAVAQVGGIRLSMTFVGRTDEFDEQVRPQRFAALSLSTKF